MINFGLCGRITNVILFFHKCIKTPSKWLSKTIRRKLISSFLLLIILPITFSSILSYVILEQVVKEKILSASKSAIPQATSSLERVFKDMRVASDAVMFSDKICEILDSPLPKDELQLYANNTKMKSEFDKIQTTVLSSYPGYSMIAVIDKNGYTYSNIPKSPTEGHTVFNNIIGELGQRYIKWSQKISKISAPELQRHLAELEKNPSYIVLLRTFADINKSSIKIGDLVIALPEFEMAKILKNAASTEGMRFYVVNNSGMIMSSTEREQVEKFYRHLNYIQDAVTNAEKTVESGKDEVIINYKRLGFTGWIVVQEIPYNFIFSEISRMRNLIIALNIAFFFVFLGVSYVIASGISKPLNKLSSASNKIACGDLETRVLVQGDDEVGTLARNFNNMAEEIQELIKSNNEAEKTKRELELQMLYAQINPHFLFNTLNSIRWMADTYRASSVSKHIVALANLLKNSIIKKNEYITVKDEIENVKNYITIQKLRYMYSFDDDYKISDNIWNCSILKLILQPIVENSIIHGFDGIDYKGKILVEAFKQDDSIIIKISDNGVGMDEETIKKLLAGNNNKKGHFSGIGVANVNQRLILHFGSEYALRIISTSGNGTMTEIKVPLVDGGM